MHFPDNRALDLICFGRAGADLYPSEFNKNMEDVSLYSISLGGSPANIAVGAAKLGLKVGFMGKVSDDPMGRFVEKRLQGFNIDTTHLIRKAGAMTSLALTEIKSPEDCSVLFYRDNVADLEFSWEEVSEAYIANAKAVLLSGTALAKSPSREAVYHIVDCAEKHGTAIIFEADYRFGTWKFPEKTSYCYDFVCKRSDIIIGTREEFNALEYLFAPDNTDDRVSAERYLTKNAKIVIIKHGSDGFEVFLNDGRVIHQDAIPTNIKKTFGAGDALFSAFLAALIKKKPLEQAIEDGAYSASIVLSRKDCTDAMPYEHELEEAKKNNKNKN